MTIFEILQLTVSCTALSGVVYLFVNRNKSPNSNLITQPIEKSIVTKKQLVAALNDNYQAYSAAQQLIESNDQLLTLFEKLGYSAKLEQEAKKHIEQMKTLIRTEIIDLPAFNRALDEVRAQAGNVTAENNQQIQIKYYIENHKLLNEILALNGDIDKTLVILNRNPIYDQLPFVEQIPFYNNGEVIWRSPVENSLIRKRPANPDLFKESLNELKTLFSTIKLTDNRQLRQEVLEIAEKLQRELQIETTYIPTTLKTLEKKLAEYLTSAPNETVALKRDLLKNLLADQLYIRNKYRFESNRNSILPKADCNDYGKLARQQVKQYLDNRSIQLPWLSRFLLVTLLNSELALLCCEDREELGNNLEKILQEIQEDLFNPIETMRRLRQQEGYGLYISSLAFSLLRLIMLEKPSK